MKPHKLKPVIKQHIKTLFDMLNPTDQLRTDDVYRYVKRMTGRQLYPDTVLRYMRQMRSDGEINYTSISKSERIIKVIEAGEGHSL